MDSSLHRAALIDAAKSSAYGSLTSRELTTDPTNP